MYITVSRPGETTQPSLVYLPEVVYPPRDVLFASLFHHGYQDVEAPFQ